MDVWRKPASAQWYYDSAQFVDDVPISASAWTGTKYIEFDGTKDKQGGRHTDMRLALSAAEVENLYQGLVKGRKAELRRLEKLEREVSKLTTDVHSKYAEADFGTKEEAVLKSLWRKLLDLR